MEDAHGPRLLKRMNFLDAASLVMLAAGVPAYLRWDKKSAAAAKKTVSKPGPNELEYIF